MERKGYFCRLLMTTVLIFSVILTVSCGDNKLTNGNTKAAHTESQTKNKNSSKKSSKISKISNSSKLHKGDNSSKSSNTSSIKKTEKKQNIIVFKDENGKVLSEQTVKNGDSAKAPASPKKKGYYFYSWSRSFDKVTGDMVITPVFLKEGCIPQIELDQVEAKVGENVEVRVLVKNNPGIASLAMDIFYDKENLKLTSFNYNTESLNGASTVPFNEKADPPCLSMVNSTDNITGEFEFATLCFEILNGAKGSYPIIISCDDDNVYNIDEVNINFELVNGLITVK